MSNQANVKLSTLYELNSSLRSFQSNMAAVKSDFDKTVKNYFVHFQKQRQVLRDRLAQAERELDTAECFLRVFEIRIKPKWGDDEDEEIHKDNMVIAAAREKVAKARQHRDRCKDLLNRCEIIINNCSYKSTFHNGCYRVIDMALTDASQCLKKHIENVQDYQNTSLGGTSSLSARSTSSFSDKTEVNQSVAEYCFYKSNEQPLRSVKITIVDNQPFGFGQIDVITNENGMISFPYHGTSDCSIYIDGKEVYSGRLYKNIHYDKSRNGVIYRSDT